MKGQNYADLTQDFSKVTINNQNEGDYINFHSTNQNSFVISSAFDINQITKDEGNAILKVKVNPNMGNNEFAAVTSNFQIHYMTINESSVYSINTFNEHKERINDIAFFKQDQSPFNQAFLSASSDGTIKLWDSRANGSVKTITSNKYAPVFCLDVSDKYLVAGYGRELGLYDLKTLKCVHKYKSGHSDDITSVKLRGNNLISGGEDDIVNLFDITNGLDSDSVVATANINQAVANLNFLDEECNYLQATTTVYSFHIVNMQTCTSMFEFDAKNDHFKTDYILDSLYNQSNNTIELFCGNNYGDIIVVDLTTGTNPPVTKFNSLISTQRIQTFNSIDSFNCRNKFIVSSDEGIAYIVQRKSEQMILEDQYKMMEDILTEESSEETHSSSKNNTKITSNYKSKYSPY